jgi:hypothetical protein
MITDDAAPQSEHQTDGVVGDLAGAVVGRIANRDSGARRRREVDMVEADAGADDDPAAPQGGHKGGVDLHLVPCDQGVAGAEGFVGELAERVRAADIPIDVVAGCLTFNDAIVGILRVRREEAKPGHGYPMLRLGAGNGGARCHGRAGPSRSRRRKQRCSRKNRRAYRRSCRAYRPESCCRT